MKGMCRPALQFARSMAGKYHLFQLLAAHGLLFARV
jgi:hypothetical protein